MNSLAHQYDTDIKTELIDGVIYAMSSPTFKHNKVAFRIAKIFDNYLSGKNCEVVQTFNLQLTEKDQFIPDVMVVCRQDIIKDDAVYGVPDIVVEVLSPATAKRDKGYKKNLYARCGVKEYWLVDTNNRSIEVYYNTDGTYELHDIYQIYPDYVIKSMTDDEKAAVVYEFKTLLFDDLLIKVEDVFDGIA
ncbi:MAG: Uma2 family endonuclease [Defluviitaleaceae bacterium]|nr:Uma2 family endonuclease [Defluviitaleaceae bacterium]